MARIVRIHEYGDASVLKLENLDVSAPAANEVQIGVKAIGLNRAEVMFRNHAYLQEAEFPAAWATRPQASWLQWVAQ
ncbi:NADPH:quinone reductase-like Zn-dependent oxidoreductase [Stenotrophomonas sp. PvP093]|uniref:hypothetical protein n=1 Tax=Stenotrophomonas sp. PvP087 TaxID=3156434 RepID=UPI001FDA9918|nr:hypothetical protein [Stenotrophomonas sp. PvP093]MBP2480531.1 NADPH:quinone reductase-like Zn-dependent oxidoreductase [Stenotrophomonas sp. PvP093]